VWRWLEAQLGRYENRMVLAALLSGVPGWVLVWVGFLDRPQTVAAVIALGVLTAATLYVPLRYIYRKSIRPLLTIQNLVRSLNEGDYSVRGIEVAYGGTPGEVIHGLNELSETLKKMRLGEREAHLLLSRMVAEVDIAVFIFDRLKRLRLANPAACELYLKSEDELQDMTAEALDLAGLLKSQNDSHRLVEQRFPARIGRFSVRRVTFHKDGRPHQLLLVSDLGKLLIEQERASWQQLLRVLGHEINNSLVPIKSMADTLDTVVKMEPLPTDWQQDLEHGLGIIAKRAGGLHQFVQGYAELTRLPAPQPRPVVLRPLFDRIIGLLGATDVQLGSDPQAACLADPSQLEQVLVNLLRNAQEATMQTGGAIAARWSQGPGLVSIEIEDWGTGIANPRNLFVPFFTTKPNGSGIGLTLCRQIVENHQGYIQVGNAVDHQGCLVRLNLPAPAARPARAG
jgi:nitrogen fixation/metabolism regulation signal transduction histidine kinase